MTAVHHLASAELKSHRAAHFLSRRDAAIVAKLSVSPPVDHRLKVQLEVGVTSCPSPSPSSRIGRRAGDQELATASDKDAFTILEPERSNSDPHNAHGNGTVTYVHQGYRFTVT